VALESTIVAHGMPWPQNLHTARAVEAVVREHGAEPATIAVIDGRIRIGLDDATLERLAHAGPKALKVSRRDLPAVLAGGATSPTGTNVSVLDISGKALEVCRKRLGDRARQVKWIAANVLDHAFEPKSVAVWHDRAVFHFLTDEAQRRAYVAQALRALRPGGYAIVGTFGPEGPVQCSGLPVARYDADALHDEFGGQFRLIESSTNVHTTPWGSPQQFVYCFCKLEH
jgi:SAM-dependent methyltransferase